MSDGRKRKGERTVAISSTRKRHCQSIGVPYHTDFRAPTREESEAAMQDSQPKTLFTEFDKLVHHWDNVKAFLPDWGIYRPLPVCLSEDDWLVNVAETPQTFQDYRKALDDPAQKLSNARLKPLAVRILPVGDMTRHFVTYPEPSELPALRTFIDIFFGGRLEVVVLPPADVHHVRVCDGNGDKHNQLYLTSRWKPGKRTKLHHRVCSDWPCKLRSLTENGLLHRQISLPSLLNALCKIRASALFQQAHGEDTILFAITREDPICEKNKVNFCAHHKCCF